MSNAPIQPKTADQRLAALARSASNMTLLKFISGRWLIADTAVPADTKFVLFADQVSHSWIRFAGGKVADEIVALVINDVEGDSEQRIVKGQGRADLGYQDQAEWDIDNSGKPRDPWTYGFGLPMSYLSTGGLVIYKTSTVGGMGAIAEQVANYRRNAHLGYPIATLGTSTYKNKKYGGFVSVPLFISAGFDAPPPPPAASGGDGARVIGESQARNADMDNIPF
jgi:hypothetical protein